MCSPDLRYKSISISGGVLSFNANRRDTTNRIVSAGAGFTLAISNIKNGSYHRLIVVKSIAGDLTITTNAADMVFGVGLGSPIVLSGAANTKFELEITNDGSVNCIKKIIATSTDTSGFLTKTLEIINVVTVGAAYTLQASDCGKLLRFTDVPPVTVTLPNSLPSGFNVGVLQDAAGQITFGAEGGATLQNRLGNTKTAGLRATVALMVVSNLANNNAVWNLSGDTA